MRVTRQASAPPVDPASKASRRAAVFIDGSALYTANPAEDRRLNYFGLIDVLTAQVDGLQRPGSAEDSPWVMWTSADSRNQGQTKFLEFAEERLRWEVRTAPPSQSFMIDPADLFGLGTPEPSRMGRLLRFDAPIAFAMGRLAESHKLVVISDSFGFASTVALINEHWGARTGGCVLAFFGCRLDSRWRHAMRADSRLQFVDFDDFRHELFGLDQEEVAAPARKPGRFVF